MYILFSVDHISIFSKSLEKVWLKKKWYYSSLHLRTGWYRKCVYQWWSCPDLKAYHSQIGEIKLDRGSIPAVPLVWQVSAPMLYVLVSQTFVAFPDTIRTRPCYLGWHRTSIISSVTDCDWLRGTLYGNQQNEDEKKMKWKKQKCNWVTFIPNTAIGGH